MKQVTKNVATLNEVKEESKLETFEDKMNFLAKDEQEAIDGYDKVLALLDAEKDAVVIEQLNKIKVEEEAHKKYLEDVKENHDLVYTEPLEQDSLEEAKEDKKIEYIEMPHEVYTKPEDIKRVNDELDKKAREGKLIGIRKEKKMLQLAEPAVNDIWTIYLNDKGFIEKIVVF